MARALPQVFSGKGVLWCGPDSVTVEILSLFCVECGKDRDGVMGERCQRGQNHLFTQFSSVSGFESWPLLSRSSFWHSPSSSGGHFRSGTLAVTAPVSVSFPLAVTEPPV